MWRNLRYISIFSYRDLCNPRKTWKGKKNLFLSIISCKSPVALCSIFMAGLLFLGLCCCYWDLKTESPDALASCFLFTFPKVKKVEERGIGWEKGGTVKEKRKKGICWWRFSLNCERTEIKFWNKLVFIMDTELKCEFFIELKNVLQQTKCMCLKNSLLRWISNILDCIKAK